MKQDDEDRVDGLIKMGVSVSDARDVVRKTTMLGGPAELKTVLSALGKPDYVNTHDLQYWEKHSRQIPEKNRWSKCYRFSSQWSSVSVDVLVMMDGTVNFAYAPKQT